MTIWSRCKILASEVRACTESKTFLLHDDIISCRRDMDLYGGGGVTGSSGAKGKFWNQNLLNVSTFPSSQTSQFCFVDLYFDFIIFKIIETFILNVNPTNTKQLFKLEKLSGILSRNAPLVMYDSKKERVEEKTFKKGYQSKLKINPGCTEDNGIRLTCQANTEAFQSLWDWYHTIRWWMEGEDPQVAAQHKDTPEGQCCHKIHQNHPSTVATSSDQYHHSSLDLQI